MAGRGGGGGDMAGRGGGGGITTFIRKIHITIF